MKGSSRAASKGPHYKDKKLKTFGADKLSHALLHTSSSIIIGLDSKATVVLFNSGAETATGWNAKSAIGKNWIDVFIPKSERKLLRLAFESTVMREGHMSKFENRLLTKSGKHIHVKWNNTVITAGGGFLMTLSVGEDVTKLKHTETKLLRQNTELEELSKMREQFLADITHELKTPLSIILLNLDLVRRGCKAHHCTKMKKPMDLMWRNAMRLSRSIEGIMELTKLDSVEFQPVKFSLLSVMRWVVDDYQPIAESKKIRLIISGKDAMVMGDPHILAMAASNLVSNALKFTDKGEVGISWLENNGDVVISVSDTGSGISKKNKSRVFTKFFKENHNAPGSGIGLAVSFGLVKKIGGTMNFHSTPGRGSTFTITIPKEVKK